ncbi:SgcJ/EcaC family oxidoreductase [Prauserella cavernicola]|uniref:SgcJ/EcaC family oxidoreductase n=1 Tax=Prauserella cavernicola TaxID=2800127 RepID=A0A934QT01_9PSEU|nr:SgcJ/EcaC family oxidoreductase [Prauserella cavernicola]MBK1785775.1 SgcJ/EcaC family oxidoreductase [Prauserella cavernicola]
MSRETPPPALTDTTTDHAADRAAIERVVADTEKAYNTNDPELLTEHFAQDATVVNAMGVLLSGRDTLLESNRAGLAGFLRDQYVRYDLLDVVFVRPDVALAHKGARATDATGELIDLDHAMIALYVLVKQDGRWWVAARQNTLVPAEG